MIMQNRLKKNKLTVFYAVCCCALAGSLLSCNTQKNTFFYRSYHGITTRFNIYYNGHESYKEAVEVIDYAAKDNYTSILPVYNAPDKTEALKSSPQLDRTIEKCSKAIKKHSMYIRGVEYCKPIPETYLLMGKAYYKRQDYADALSIFNYNASTHTNAKIWVEANTWKARTYLAMNRLDDAQEVLETVRVPVFDCKKDKYKLHWEAAFADYYLKVKDYEQASIYLTEVLQHKHIKKDFRTRIRFILGQVHQLLGQNTDAAVQYEYVVKKTPPYEMEFNAAVNLALCSKENSKQEKSAYDKLRKMLKDERNATYRDQIFYAMAQLDLREEKTEEAIENLEASVFWSIDNMHQKTLSSLTLAEMYFNQSQYIESQMYYDTAINIIPTSYPNYNEIKERAAVLKNLVKNLVIIDREESLQRIANMGDKERERYIDSLVRDYKIQEEKRIAKEDAKTALIQTANDMKNAPKSGGSGAWLFYNPTQLKLGMQEFRKRWGNRKLEDYWAVNDISIMNFFVEETKQEEVGGEEDDEAAADKKTPASRTSDPENPAYYLQDVPFTQTQMDSSNEALVGALYNAGMIYYDDLDEVKKSVKLLEELATRYRGHKLYPLACFQLYKEYWVLRDEEKSDYYKNIILEEYPNSDFAAIINDPDYYKKIEAIRDQANAFYILVYDAYKKADYPAVVNLANEGLSKYPTPELSPKFEFLKAIALSKLFGNDTLKALLRDISYKYPTTEIDTAAAELLEILKRMETEKPVEKDTVQQQTSAVPDVPIYTYDDKAFHFVIIIISIKEANIEPLKGKINTFNRDFFRLEHFDVGSFYLDDYNQLITVSKFQDKSKVMDYYKLMKVDTKYLESLNTNPNAKIYVISDANYNTFYKNKDKWEEYEAFFKEYYLK
jgi:hypothetical protein